MAASSAFSSSSEYKIPLEPAPCPSIVRSLTSDEESFVVLGKSLTAELEDLVVDDTFERSIIQEAKQLIRDELAQIDKSSVVETNSSAQENNTKQSFVCNKSGEPDQNAKKDEILMTQSAFQTANFGDLQMDQSAALPVMPHMGKEVPNNDVSRAISIVSFSPSEFASEELQIKVNQLIDENIHLKDTIMQNNMSMKAQYKRIVAWQEDVQKVHQAHKEKFLQAKQFIEGLKKDNANLKQEIDKLTSALALEEKEKHTTKQIITQSSENNLMSFELDIANKRITGLEAAMQNLTIKSNEDLSNERMKSKKMEDKLVAYEKELENAYKKLRDFEKTLESGLLNEDASTGKNDVAKIKELEEKFLQSEISCNDANKKIMDLQEKLAGQDSVEIHNELQQANNQIAELKKMVTERNTSLMETSLKTKKMEESLFQAQETNTMLKESINTLTATLEETKIDLWKQKQKHTENGSRIQVLQRDVQLSLQKNSAEPNHEGIASLHHQLMESQKALTDSEQKRAVAYAQIEAQKIEIVDLSKVLKGRQVETDDMFALRTQLDVYKTDFEAEREAKDNVKLEKVKLTEDLQHLHRRNQQLQEEIELLREQLSHFGEVPRHRNELSSHNDQGAGGWRTGNQNKKQRILNCPKCNFGFYDINSLENHVFRCIELDESLP